MKKKAIEKIPFMKLRKLSKKKGIKYIGVTDIKNVGNEKHLFLEIYKNEKESRDIPVVRIVLTKKDFSSFFPETEKWSRQKIETDRVYNGGLLWGEERNTWQQREKENILQSTEDLERIKKFCEGKVWNEKRWWEYICKHEDKITAVERLRAKEKEYKRRQGRAK